MREGGWGGRAEIRRGDRGVGKGGEGEDEEAGWVGRRPGACVCYSHGGRNTEGGAHVLIKTEHRDILSWVVGGARNRN